MIWWSKASGIGKPLCAWAIAWAMRRERQRFSANAFRNCDAYLSLFGHSLKVPLMNEKFSAYAHPEALVDTAWLEAHLQDPNIRIVESNEDVLLYDTGHIPGAVHIDWRGDLQDDTSRDYVQPEQFAEICR